MLELSTITLSQHRNRTRKDRLSIQLLYAAVTVFLTFAVGNSLAIGAENFVKLKEEGIQARKEKNWDVAIDRLNRAAKVCPDDAEIQYLLGTSLGFSGQYTKAQAALRRALAINPEYGDATLALARTMSWTGDHKSALAEVTPLLSKQNNNPEALVLAGRLNYFLHRYDHASTYLTRALQLDPKNVEALIGKGDVLLAQKRFEDAEKTYAKAAEVAPNTKGLDKKLKVSRERPTRWRVDLNVEGTGFEEKLDDWWHTNMQTTYAYSSRTNAWFRYEFFERFKDTGHLYTLGGSHQVLDWLWARASIGISSPRADYLGKEYYQLGSTARLWKGSHHKILGQFIGPTFLTVENYFSRFDRQNIGSIYRLDPGLQQYIGKRFWATFRAVTMWDLKNDLFDWGYFIRGDWQLLDNLRLFTGYADAPEPAITAGQDRTDVARILRTRTILGGFVYDITSRFAVNLTYSRDHRDIEKDRFGPSRHVSVGHTGVIGTTIRF